MGSERPEKVRAILRLSTMGNRSHDYSSRLDEGFDIVVMCTPMLAPFQGRMLSFGWRIRIMALRPSRLTP